MTALQVRDRLQSLVEGGHKPTRCPDFSEIPF
jgi:hypothetical protein